MKQTLDVAANLTPRAAVRTPTATRHAGSGVERSVHPADAVGGPGSGMRFSLGMAALNIAASLAAHAEVGALSTARLAC